MRVIKIYERIKYGHLGTGIRDYQRQFVTDLCEPHEIPQ